MIKIFFDLLHLKLFLMPDDFSGKDRLPESAFPLLEYAVLAEEKFNALTLKQIDSPEINTRFIIDRLKLVHLPEVQDNLPEDPSELTLAQLRSLTTEQMIDYLKNIDLSHLNPWQLTVLFNSQKEK